MCKKHHIASAIKRYVYDLLRSKHVCARFFQELACVALSSVINDYCEKYMKKNLYFR